MFESPGPEGTPSTPDVPQGDSRGAETNPRDAAARAERFGMASLKRMEGASHEARDGGKTLDQSDSRKWELPQEVDSAANRELLLQKLQEQGYEKGTNVAVEYRFGYLGPVVTIFIDGKGPFLAASPRSAQNAFTQACGKIDNSGQLQGEARNAFDAILKKTRQWDMPDELKTPANLARLARTMQEKGYQNGPSPTVTSGFGNLGQVVDIKIGDQTFRGLHPRDASAAFSKALAKMAEA